MTSNEFNIFKCNINKLCEQALKEKPYLNQGQVVYNILKEEFPGIVARIKSKQIDPTENDNNINEFWNILSKKLII